MKSAFLIACATLVTTSAIVVISAFGASSRGEPDTADTSVEIRVPSSGALQRLRLPLEVLRRSRSEGFADLRVVDARGLTLPMAWVHAPTVEPPRIDRVALPFVAWPVDRPPTPTVGASTQIE